MRDVSFKAYLIAAVVGATAIDLAFLWQIGMPLYSPADDPGDFAAFVTLWPITVIMTVIATFVPSAAMAGLAGKLRIRCCYFFVGWSLATSLLGADLLTTWLYRPDFPPDDPDYLSFAGLLYRLARPLGCGGIVGGAVYWWIAGRHAPASGRNAL